MSEVNTSNAATVAKELSPMEELQLAFNKTGAVIIKDMDNSPLSTPLKEMLSSWKDNSFLNWCTKAPDEFNGVALIKTKDAKQIRLVPFAPKEIALADNVVRDALYEQYIRMVRKTARNPQATESNFLTPSGVVTAININEAWMFQRKQWTKFLKDRGLKDIGVNSLKQALSNTAKALMLFPEFPKDQWETVLKLMADRAAKHGYSTAIYSYWSSTRDLQTAAPIKAISLGEDLASILAAIDAVDEDEDDEAEDLTDADNAVNAGATEPATA